jgi:MYXO-CTERM domain-containing protein
MMPPMVRSLLLGAILFFLASPAAAEPAAPDELTTLMQELDAEHAALATVDCGAACRALESLERLVGRICALDAGRPCADARKKLEDATRRVREACGDCAHTATVEEEPEDTGTTPKQAPEHLEGEAQAGAPADQPAAPPPEAESRGGCAACAVDERSPGAGLGWLALAALVAWRRRFTAR